MIPQGGIGGVKSPQSNKIIGGYAHTAFTFFNIFHLFTTHAYTSLSVSPLIYRNKRLTNWLFSHHYTSFFSHICPISKNFFLPMTKEIGQNTSIFSLFNDYKRLLNLSIPVPSEKSGMLRAKSGILTEKSGIRDRYYDR